MAEKDDQRVRGEEVLREARDFLGRMTFATGRSDFAEGEHVAVLVDPWPNRDGTLTAHVTCRPFGHRDVDWNRLALWVPYDSQGEPRIALAPPMDAHGQTAFCPLPYGEYALGIGERTGRGVTVEQQAEVPMEAAAAMDADEAGSPAAGPTDALLREARVYPSLDGALRATLRPVAAGIEVAFETSDRRLAGRRVFFGLVPVAEPGAADVRRVAATGEVVLAPVAVSPDVWEGVWRGGLPTTGPCEPVFWIVAEPERTDR